MLSRLFRRKKIDIDFHLPLDGLPSRAREFACSLSEPEKEAFTVYLLSIAALELVRRGDRTYQPTILEMIDSARDAQIFVEAAIRGGMAHQILDAYRKADAL